MRNSYSRLTLFLPLILVLAGCYSNSAREQAPQVIAANELAAMTKLRSIAKAQALYMVQAGGRYATLDELTQKQLVTDPMEGKLKGYSFEIQLKPVGFEATAVPIQPGISGKRSFYIDETNVLRGAEKQGAKATASDQEI